MKAKAPGAMGHVLPTSVTFSKSETATLGLALLVVVGALLLGVVVVASLYCLLVRYLWSSKRKRNDISFFLINHFIFYHCRRKARNEEEFVSWVYRMQKGGNNSIQ